MNWKTKGRWTPTGRLRNNGTETEIVEAESGKVAWADTRAWTNALVNKNRVKQARALDCAS